MAVPPGGKDDLVHVCERFLKRSNETITGALSHNFFIIELIYSHCRKFGKHKEEKLIKQ